MMVTHRTGKSLRSMYGILRAGRMSHGTAHLPSSQRYHVTVQGIREAAWLLGFDTPSDLVRAYPIPVSCRPALSDTGILGRSWRPLWEPDSPRLPLSELRFYQWDSLYHRMRHRPVGRDR